MIETKNTTKWKPYGRKILVEARRRKTDSKLILSKTVSEYARELYDYYLCDKGSLVPDDLEIGAQLYISLPGLEFIEGVTDEDAEITFYLADYNFIKAQENIKK
jgi:hypothetical protein